MNSFKVYETNTYKRWNFGTRHISSNGHEQKKRARNPPAPGERGASDPTPALSHSGGFQPVIQ